MPNQRPRRKREHARDEYESVRNAGTRLSCIRALSIRVSPTQHEHVQPSWIREQPLEEPAIEDSPENQAADFFYRVWYRLVIRMLDQKQKNRESRRLQVESS